MLVEQCIKFFAKKFQISIRTTQDFSIVIVSEFVLLTNRCINPYVDFLIVVSKLLIPVSVHRSGAASPWLTENTTICVVKSYT